METSNVNYRKYKKQIVVREKYEKEKDDCLRIRGRVDRKIVGAIEPGRMADSDDRSCRDGETISKSQIAGLVLDVAGIVLIIQPWHLRLDALGVVYVLLAPLLAFLVLHEAIPGNMLAGIACILCGSLVSILPGLLAQRRAAALPFAEDTVKEEIEI